MMTGDDTSRQRRRQIPPSLWIIYLFMVALSLFFLHQNQSVMYSFLDSGYKKEKQSSTPPVIINSPTTMNQSKDDDADSTMTLLTMPTNNSNPSRNGTNNTDTTSNDNVIIEKQIASDGGDDGSSSQQQQKQHGEDREKMLQYWIDHKTLLDPSASDRCQKTRSLLSLLGTDPRIENGCFCQEDPTKPVSKDNKDWHDHHANMILDAIKATEKYTTCNNSDIKSSSKLQMEQHDQKQQQNNLDLVMIGDSIIERWNGTRALGRFTEPEMRHVYESMFTKDGGGILEGIAFGSAGDTSSNLLWHLHNGLLLQGITRQQQENMPPPQLYPKIWLVFIGTNNIFFNHCSRSFALAGILNVVKLLQEERPNSHIIIHGILPRLDNRQEPYLRDHWSHAKEINGWLAKIANEQANLHYMDASSIFLAKTSGTNSSSSKRINPSLMADGVHPTVRGLQVWGDYIVRYVSELLYRIN